jgi:hypothetical protein
MLKYDDYPEEVVKKCLKYVEDITDEEVWEVARESEEIPNFSNIYLYLLFEKAAEELRDTHTLGWYVNNLDTTIEFIKLKENENDYSRS